MIGLNRPLENANPIEFDVGVLLLDQPNRFLIERISPDFHTRRRAEAIEDARLRVAPSSFRVDQIRCLVASLVAVETQERQGLLPLLRARWLP